MANDQSVVKYVFVEPSEETSYRLFTEKIENDEIVAFHGTACANLNSILDNGFELKGPLESLSFSKNSNVALNYACDARSATSPDGCVIAVRFDSLDKPSICVGPSIIHVYDLNDQPKVISYCIVPASYVFS